MGPGEQNIFEFAHYREYLHHLKDTRWVIRGRPLTLNRISEKLGYKSPRLLGMILNGQRIPSEEFINRLASHIRMNSSQKHYFELLVKYDRQKGKNKDISGTIEEIRKILPGASYDIEMENRVFHYISDWYCVVLKQMQNISGLKWEPIKIRSLLRNKLSTQEIVQALKNLNKLGLYGKSKNESFVTQQSVPDAAIKKHHEQMMKRAAEALNEQSVKDREFTSLTLAFNQDEIDEAKTFIRSFRDQFNKRFHSGNADSVYQINMQFFAHTKTKDSSDA